MKLKTCCLSLRPIVRRAASFSRSSRMCEAGRSRPCTAGTSDSLHAGMLNGIFGEGEDRHIAHWRSVKFTDHWEEEEADGTRILHDRERFSHELTLIFANGKTQTLTHEKKEPE